MSWEPICSRDTPYTALAEITENAAEWSLREVRASLAEQLGPELLAVVMEKLEPIVRERARIAVEQAWQGLQAKH